MIHCYFLYKTLVLPIIDYGDIVYHGISQLEANCLQRLQNSACRAILRAEMRTSIDEMHAELDVNTLYQRRCQHIATQVFKLLRGMGPQNCQNMLTRVGYANGVSTRSSEKCTLVVPATRLRVTDNDFYVTGPKIWNQLPVQIRTLDSLESFKTEVKHFKFT